LKLPIYPYPWFGDCHTGDSYLKSLLVLALQSLVLWTSGPQDYTKPCIQCVSYTHLAECALLAVNRIQS